jgi:hypothetical protein
MSFCVGEDESLRVQLKNLYKDDPDMTYVRETKKSQRLTLNPERKSNLNVAVYSTR